jgi:RimJ/RimL family protein N-acetyltransferase
MHTTFRGISLRQVVENDMPVLFRLFADPIRCHLWMRNRRVYDERGFYQAWSAWTSDMIGAKFIVESTGKPIGLAFEYDRALEDGFTKVTVLMEEASAGHGSGVIATALIVAWLFQTLPLRKVYMDVYAYNPAVVRMLRKLGFAEEAVLKQVRFWNDAFWDLHVFSLAREACPSLRDRLLRLPRTERPRPSNRIGSSSPEVSLSDLHGLRDDCLNGAE